MSMNNFSNRPQLCMDLGTVEDTKTYGLLHATKKLLVKRVDLIALAALAADAANHHDMQLKITNAAGNDTDVGDDVGTEAGVTKGAALNLPENRAGQVLKPGETLVLTATKAGNGTWANPFVAIDYEVVGN